MTEQAIKALKEHILQSGVSPVYIGDLPSLDLECVALKPIDGYANTRYFGATDLDEPLVEVVVRSVSYEVGQQWYNKIKDTLDRYSNRSVGIMSCLLTGSPGYLGKDINNFGEWHMIFHVTLNDT